MRLQGYPPGGEPSLSDVDTPSGPLVRLQGYPTEGAPSLSYSEGPPGPLMQLRGYPTDGLPALSYVGTPTGSLVGSTTPPVGRLISVPGLPGARGPAGTNASVFDETPTGTKDGANATFDLAFPYVAASTRVYRNGLREQFYTESSQSIVFTSPPLTTDILTVDYLRT